MNWRHRSDNQKTSVFQKCTFWRCNYERKIYIFSSSTIRHNTYTIGYYSPEHILVQLSVTSEQINTFFIAPEQLQKLVITPMFSIIMYVVATSWNRSFREKLHVTRNRNVSFTLREIQKYFTILSLYHEMVSLEFDIL